MAIEFTVSLEDRPGKLADLTETLARHAVNIIAIHASPCTAEGIIQFMTNNNDATVNALRDAQMDYTTNEVLLVTLANQPGMLAKLARGLSDQQINVNAIYITMTGQVVLDVSDVKAAQQVVFGMNLSGGTSPLG